MNDYQVIDTARPLVSAKGFVIDPHMTMCETFDQSTAERIAKALNLTEGDEL